MAYYYCIVCTSNLDLVSFHFVPVLYSTLKFLVSSLFVLSHVIVDETYICTRQPCIIQLFFALVCIKSIVEKQVVTM